MLRQSVVTKLDGAGISSDVLETTPYSVWHIGDLEWGTQIISQIGISPFFDGKLKDEEMPEWEWLAYMSHCFGKRIPRTNLFADKYDAIFSSV
jgi:hypothetical protein